MDNGVTGLWRVYAHIHQLDTIYVTAPSADAALGRARERLAVDMLPSAYSTVSQPTEVDTDDIAWMRERSGRDPLQGRQLTADELAYCAGRGYDAGYDIDAFLGIQWSHIVDDSVTLCRTTALWGAGATLDRVSCPFCEEILRREMRYPYLRLQIDRRRAGNHGIANVVHINDAWELHVNDVTVRRVVPVIGEEDAVHRELVELCDKINKAHAVAREATPLRPRSLVYDDEWRATYIMKRLAIMRMHGDATADTATIARLTSEMEAAYQEMTPSQRNNVAAYFRDATDEE
jgi:hypothetical protein